MSRLIWIKRFWGRTSGKDPSNEQVPENGYGKDLQALLGKVGTTVTKLRFCGIVEIEGKRFDAISKQTLVQKGERVQIVGHRFGLLLVKPLTGSISPSNT